MFDLLPTHQRRRFIVRKGLRIQPVDATHLADARDRATATAVMCERVVAVFSFNLSSGSSVAALFNQGDQLQEQSIPLLCLAISQDGLRFFSYASCDR
jgi:hypothetical protein